MIYINNFSSLLVLDPDAVAIKITDLLSQEIPFINIYDFPKERGIYFLYLKNNNKPIYIGSASTNGRNLKIRCQQYLQNGSGGSSFAGKIASLKNITRAESIRFIRDNVTARFIVAKNLSEMLIKQRELTCIWAFRPQLNFIQPNSTFEEMAWR